MGAESPLQRGPGHANGLADDSGDHCLFGWLHDSPPSSPAAVGIVLCNPFAAMRRFARIAVCVPLRKPSQRPDCRHCASITRARVIPARSILERINFTFGRRMSSQPRKSAAPSRCGSDLRPGNPPRRSSRNACGGTMQNNQFSRADFAHPERPPLPTGIENHSLGGSSGASRHGCRPERAGCRCDGDQCFTFSAATLASLRTLDFTQAPTPPAHDLLIIDGSTMPVASQWAQSLAERSARVKYLSLPGLVEMVMTAPQFATRPQEMIAATSDWMTQLAARAEPNLSFASRGETGPARSTLLSLAAETSVPGASRL